MFGRESGVARAKRCSLVTGSAVVGYQEKEDGVVSTNLVWSDAN